MKLSVIIPIYNTHKILLKSERISINKYRDYSDIVKAIQLNILGVNIL